ncbi:hypothetical protein C7431_11113 [Pantoea allii]|uniref:Uncharacterized protein n=1 Tax=Pantoea allii TaxID=574096 RepID=A0A2V2BC17_9GAMM|nr:hypothetical protein [Pantoea allii]PWK94278.1 hypothetical protein C7431_11113 [Pantoea allii]
MANKKFTNEGNSYSASEVVAYWAGKGCRTCWLFSTVNYLGENLLVLLSEENGVYEEMASRLDAPDMKDWSVQLSGTALTFSSLPARAVEVDLSIPAEAAFKMDIL